MVDCAASTAEQAPARHRTSPEDLKFPSQYDSQDAGKERRTAHSISTGLSGDGTSSLNCGLASPECHDDSPGRAGDVLSLSSRQAAEKAPSRLPQHACQPQASSIPQVSQHVPSTQIQVALTLEQREALHTRMVTKLNQVLHGQAAQATRLFSKRLASLEDACKQADALYLVIHRLFCLWSLGTPDAQDFLHQLIEPATANAAFTRVTLYLQSNSPPNMSFDQLEFLANYPADADWDCAAISATQRGQYFTQASQFLRMFAQMHDKVQRHWLMRGYPPLADELLTFFKLTSPVLQMVIFRSYRRRLTEGGAAERHAAAMDRFFGQDQENHRDKYGLMHATSRPSYVGDIENRHANKVLATAYRSLINGEIGQANLSSVTSARLSQQHQQVAPGQAGAHWNTEGLVFDAQRYQNFQPHQIQQPQVLAQRPEQLPQEPNLQQVARPCLPQATQASQLTRQRVEALRGRTPLQSHARLTQPAPVRPAGPMERQAHQGFSGIPTAQMPSVSSSSWYCPAGRGQISPSEVQSLWAGLPPTTFQHSTYSNFQHAQLQQNQQVAAHMPLQPASSQPSAIYMPSTSTTPHTRSMMPSPRQSANTSQYPLPMGFQQVQSNAQLAVTSPVGAGTPRQPAARTPSQISYDPQGISPIMGPLHQILAQSPDLAPARAHSKALRYYQYVKDFPFHPSPIIPSEDLYQVTFNVSPDEFSRVVESNYTVGCRVPVSKFESGSLRYRLKCVAIKEDSCMTPGRWVTTEVEWPKHIFIRVNNRSFIHPCHESGFSKDLPIHLEKSILQPGKNEIAVSLPLAAGIPSGVTFHIAVELIEFQSHGELINHIKTNQVLDAGESRLLIQRKVSGASLDDEVAVVSTDLPVDLADPWSSTIWTVPVRGRECTHVECFDLETWLTSRPARSCLHGRSHHLCGPDCQSAEPSLIDKWKCPICYGDARPLSLVIDGFLLSIRESLAESNRLDQVKSIRMCADGTWQPKAVEEDNDDEDEGEALGPSRTGSTRTPATPTGPVEIIELG